MRPPSVKTVAVNEIRERILDGVLPLGSKIEQDVLASELGVSRLPIREALIILEGEGLVRSVPRRGAFVAEISREDIRDHYRIFGFVSGLAAEHATARITDNELRRMVDLAEQMEGSGVQRGELDDLNVQFHAVLNRASRSQRLRSMIRSLGRMLPAQSYEPLNDWPAQAHRDHRAILDALRVRDAAAVRSLTEAHFSAVGEDAVTHLESRGFWKD